MSASAGAEQAVSAARDLSGPGSFELNLSSGEVACSPELYRIFGLSPGEVEPSWAAFLAHVHPEDVVRVRRHVRRALAQRRTASVLHCIVRADGRVRELLTRMRMVESDITPGEVRVIGLCEDVTDQRQEAEERRDDRERFQLAFENAPIGMALTALDGQWLQVNRALCDITGYSEGTLLAGSSQDITQPDDLDVASRGASKLLRGETRSHRMELHYVHAQGHRIAVNVSMSLVRDVDGHPRYFIAQIEDITERRRVEEENTRLEAGLQQAQRLEMIGRLAGGIAHDFNNLMAVILNYAAILELDLQPGADTSEEVAEIRRAAEQATALTKRLVAFSRGQMIEPEVVDLNAIVRDAEALLRVTAGPAVDLKTELSAESWPVEADVDQLHRVLLNLAINARDAMPAGGSLRIATENVVLDPIRAVRFSEPLDPGRYICLSITDTGSGMTDEVAKRAFEPFFTTKDPQDSWGGLGLATVYSTVSQVGGRVEIDSAVGAGTTIRVYLPVTERRASPRPPILAIDAVQGSGETILVVEDVDAVRRLVVGLLSRNGYTVLAAREPAEALGHAAETDRVDLLLSDVVMPTMSGPELATRLSASRPDMKIMFMSAYTERAGGLESAGAMLVKKPFTREVLLNGVANALFERAEGAPPVRNANY